MRIKRSIAMPTLVFTLILSLTIASTQVRADTGTCGGQSTTLPFTDVPSSNIFFCSIAEAFFSGLTNGTSATTYSPSANVTREQMAAFITRTLDQGLRRGNRRAALDQWWAPRFDTTAGETAVGNDPTGVKSDGTDIWVAVNGNNTICRVRASDGKLIQTWTSAFSVERILCARGLVYAVGSTSHLYRIDPTQSPGPVTQVTNALGFNPHSIAFDGERIWTTNPGPPGSVSIYNTRTGSLSTVTAGFNRPFGITYTGSNIWVTDTNAHTLLKLNSTGSILQTLPTGVGTANPAFDGANIWVPNAAADSITIVRTNDASGNPLTTPFVLTTLMGNNIDGPLEAAFDGERMLVTNFSGNSVSLWKATDLTPLGSFGSILGDGPFGVCSDGLNFWITLNGAGRLKRF